MSGIALHFKGEKKPQQCHWQWFPKFGEPRAAGAVNESHGVMYLGAGST